MAGEVALSDSIHGVSQKLNGVHPMTNGISKSSTTVLSNGNSPFDISELAATISANTATVNDYLRANHLPVPSFHEDGPVNLKLSPEAEKARIVALEASTQLHDLLRGPVELIRPTASSLDLLTNDPANIGLRYPDQWSQSRSHLQV